MTMSNEALAAYLTANPKAAYAARHDAEFAAEVARMRMVLDRLEDGLEAEGLDAQVRRRIGERLVTDCLLTDRGRAQQEEYHQRARTFGQWLVER